MSAMISPLKEDCFSVFEDSTGELVKNCLLYFQSKGTALVVVAVGKSTAM